MFSAQNQNFLGGEFLPVPDMLQAKEHSECHLLCDRLKVRSPMILSHSPLKLCIHSTDTFPSLGASFWFSKYTGVDKLSQPSQWRQEGSAPLS